MQLIPFDKNDYILEIYNEGKLFRFVDKKMQEKELIQFSPIIWSDGIKRQWFNPTFTLVNGKIELAFI
mgnify:CR=1 FL=1